MVCPSFRLQLSTEAPSADPRGRWAASRRGNRSVRRQGSQRDLPGGPALPRDDDRGAVAEQPLVGGDPDPGALDLAPGPAPQLPT